MFLAIDTVVLALRALSFIAIFQAAGNAMFLELFRAQLSADAEQRIRLHARIATLAALLLSVFYYVLTPARMAGSFEGAFDPALGALQLESNAGIASIARVVGLAVLLLSLDRPSRINSIAAMGGVLLALGSFALMGHTAIHPLRWVLAPLLLAHVATAAFWFGALTPLLVVANTSDAGEGASAIVARFAALAIRCVPLLFVCGVLLAVIFIRSVAEAVTPYGALVLSKALVFGVLLWFAALNKARAGAALAQRDAVATRAFQRTLVAEWALLAVVLAGTALLTTLFAPEHLEGAFGADHSMDSGGAGGPAD